VSTDAAHLTPLDSPPADASPWTDAPAPKVPIHWRLDPRLSGSRPQVEDTFALYLAGLLGTWIAGAVFGAGLVLIQVIVSRPGMSDIGWMFPGALIGAIAGTVLAGLASIFTFPVAFTLQVLAGLHNRAPWIVAMAGGWAGLAATCQLATLGDLSFLPYVLVATSLGQAGAGWAAAQARRRQLAIGAWSDPATRGQFNLRQLMGLTAFVAIVAATLASLPLGDDTKAVIGCGVVFQALLMGSYFAFEVCRWPRDVPRVDGRTRSHLEA
jgi:hypothetical protein